MVTNHQSGSATKIFLGQDDRLRMGCQFHSNPSRLDSILLQDGEEPIHQATVLVAGAYDHSRSTYQWRKFQSRDAAVWLAKLWADACSRLFTLNLGQ
jgi:hypothetical protein